MPTRSAPVAQWHERCPPKARVPGSIPGWSFTFFFCPFVHEPNSPFFIIQHEQSTTIQPQKMLKRAKGIRPNWFHLFFGSLLVMTFFVAFKYGQYALHLSYSRQLQSVKGSGEAPKAKIDVLSWNPRVFYYHNILSDEEADHIIAIGKDHLQR